MQLPSCLVLSPSWLELLERAGSRSLLAAWSSSDSPVYTCWLRNQSWALDLYNRLSARWPGLQKNGEGLLKSLFSGLSILTNAWLFIRVLLWMTADWFISLLQFYLLLLAFFPQATPIWALFGLGAVAFGNAIPSLPGAVGTYEGALGGALILLGGDKSTALAAALIAHLYNYLATGVIGLYALSREGETLMSIYRQLRKQKNTIPEG